jgi:fluoroacetyl-CoA thioesterase
VVRRRYWPRRDGIVSLPVVSAEIGIRGLARMVVSEADTAISMRSGSVAVLATPRVIALCEEASCVAIKAALADGTTTVGTCVQFDHLQPTAVGCEVEAEAILESVDGRRLTFNVSASDDRGLVATGKVTRVVVDVDSFMARLH